jgi:FERM/RhoGEF/pleckstrin domain protein 2
LFIPQFSDVLVYAARVTQPQLQFRVHGIMPLRGVMVEEADGRTAVPHSFTIYGGNRALMVAAASAEEKRNWLGDFNKSIAAAREKPDSAVQYLSLKSASSSEDVGLSAAGGSVPSSPSHHGDAAGVVGDGHQGVSGDKPAPQVHQRSNTSVHVCWHRNTSVSSLDLRLAANVSAQHDFQLFSPFNLIGLNHVHELKLLLPYS